MAKNEETRLGSMLTGYMRVGIVSSAEEITYIYLCVCIFCHCFVKECIYKIFHTFFLNGKKQKRTKNLVNLVLVVDKKLHALFQAAIMQ